MYVCLKIYNRRALCKKVTVAPRSETNRKVFGARLNRSLDRSADTSPVFWSVYCMYTSHSVLDIKDTIDMFDTGMNAVEIELAMMRSGTSAALSVGNHSQLPFPAGLSLCHFVVIVSSYILLYSFYPFTVQWLTVYVVSQLPDKFHGHFGTPLEYIISLICWSLRCVCFTPSSFNGLLSMSLTSCLINFMGILPHR